ncbi:hypothetical protein LCGC14_0479440 [marine sediment metagenome]|uniref:Uncharacterized protein n=1 Tax=marine sediment metagenome TaxID=412755 RepID=A0A0F9VIF4_9ZZZZ
MTKDEFMKIMLDAEVCLAAKNWLKLRMLEIPGEQVDLRYLAEACSLDWLSWIAMRAYGPGLWQGAIDYRNKTPHSEEFDRAFWLASIPLEEAIERIKERKVPTFP